MDIVNIVASGQLNFTELDLEALQQDLGNDVSELKADFPRLDVKFDEDSPLIMIYSSGTYTIPGASSKKELQESREQFISYLDNVSSGELTETSFSIKYMVFMCDTEKSIDLEIASIRFGIERVEYEPEQFPGLIYRMDDPKGVILAFSTGKLLFTGFKNMELAQEAKEKIVSELF